MPPALHTWRVLAAVGYERIDATNLPDLTAGGILGLESDVEVSGEEPGAAFGTWAAQDHSSGEFTVLAHANGPAYAPFPFLLRAGRDKLIFKHDVAAGSTACLAVTYIEWPGTGVPPQ